MANTNELQTRSALAVLIEREVARSGLSLTRFAREAGVSPATVSKLINGEQRSAHRPTLEKLAKYLGHEVWGLELLGADIPVDVPGLPEVEPPQGVLQLNSALEQAIDADTMIPPKRKKWLKQCVELARQG